MTRTVNRAVFVLWLTTWVVYISCFSITNITTFFEFYCRQFGLSSLFPDDTISVGIWPINWSFRKWDYPFVYFPEINICSNMFMNFLKGAVSKLKPLRWDCLLYPLGMLWRRILFISDFPVLLDSFDPGKISR